MAMELGSPQHLLDMGLRLVDAGDLSGAQDVLVRAVNSGDPQVAPPAANVLGRLLSDSDPATAEAAFKLAIESGNIEHGTQAGWELALLYQHHGHLTGALQMFELATQSPDEQTAAQAREAVQALGDVSSDLAAEKSPAEAALDEGIHLRAAGDLAGAVAALERCIATRDAEFAPYGACQLGAILAAENEYERAKEPLLYAVRSAHSVYAPVSAYVLAEILLEEGDRADVAELLTIATEHPDAETAERAHALLDTLSA